MYLKAGEGLTLEALLYGLLLASGNDAAGRGHYQASAPGTWILLWPG